MSVILIFLGIIFLFVSLFRALISIKKKEKKTRTGFAFLILGVVCSVIGFTMLLSDDNNTEKTTSNKSQDTEVAKTELNIPEYTLNENYIKDDPSAYSGRTVVEIEIKGTFDLEDKKIKDIATSISNEESTKALDKYPDSEMVRVVIYQEGEDMFPLLNDTFNVEEGKLVLSKNTVSRFPLLDQ